ncbi:sulfite oxidase [Actinomadura parmotrematis]|uniref:Sulfite oxidase n=1 Tax=Actinomadura parmotrematis TaxID=2864039 RepID=A0ABS7FKR1_9ACTN|nr:sulfite oxidase [Actinomadura parmotrematis]MBW8480947.1 sulfite oxidase [Actinomadura parmotrematis]
MNGHPTDATVHELSRRRLLRLTAGAGAAALGARPLLAGTAAADPAPAPSPVPGIVKPLPPELFIPQGTNAEMRWEAMAGQGYYTPIDRFFVRNHTATPTIDARTWRLKLWGDGLRRSPAEDAPVEFSYAALRALPSHTIAASIECTGNGRSLYTTQQGQTVSGTAWKLGAVGVARWRGVRLSTLLERAGLLKDAVDVMPRGLDAEWVDKGRNLGHVRRPLPIAKALDDVLVAYEMNGRPLPPDHGFPARLVVPSWVGIASIKWLGDIQVSREPLSSPWNTSYYRFFGPDYPPEGSAPLTRMNVKSAFELPWDGTVQARDARVLHGRSWSGGGRVRRVDVSADGGATWRRARLHGPAAEHGWVRWAAPWHPAAGRHELLARATDATGAVQPDAAPYNTLGYLFGAVARHPITVQ